MRILLLASPFLGTEVLDLVGLDTESRRREHNMVVVDASLPDLRRVVKDLLPVDVAICRFANQPNAIGVARWLAASTPVVCSGDAIDTARDQVRTLQVLNQNKIPTPASVIADRLTEPAAVITELGKPVVCKTPLTCGGAGVWLANDERDVCLALAGLDDGELLVMQRYHTEAKGQDLRLLVVGSRVIGSIRRVAAAGEFRANLFQGARAYPHQPSAEEEHLAVEAAAAIDLDVAGIDILLTSGGPVVLEVNPKPGNTGMDGSAAAVVDLAEQKAQLG